MKLTVLYQTSSLLQDYMQKQGFSSPYIKRHVQLLNFILVRAPIFGWNTLEDAIHWFENEAYTDRYLKDVKKYFSISSSFMNTDAFLVMDP